jgi:tetratricopeptide (TPR) repeat protein
VKPVDKKSLTKQVLSSRDGGNASLIGTCVFAAVFLVAATAVAYWGVSRNEFINWDDGEYVTRNPHVRSGLTLEGIKWAFTQAYASNWHPLTWMSHMLDVQMFGMNPAGHHMVNLAIHILNTLLLLGFLAYSTRRSWASALVAALFALHPLHVESVAWVAERKDVLSTFFCFAAIWAYIWYANKSGLWRYMTVVLLFAMGLMSKPMLVTLPMVLLLLDYWPLERLDIHRVGYSLKMTSAGVSLRRLIIEKVPLMVMAIASAIVTLRAQRLAIMSLGSMDWVVRLTNAIVSYGRYAWKMVWPENLALYYPRPSEPLYWQAAVVLVLLASGAVLIWHGKSRKYARVGFLWYMVTLVPVIGIVQVGLQSHADRYTYIPLVGLFIAIVWWASEIIDKYPGLRRAAVLLAVTILIAVGALTWRTVGYWRDFETIFGRASAVTEKNCLALTNFGLSLMDRDDLDRAVTVLSQAVEAGPRDALALGALGSVLFKKGNFADALDLYFRALAASPRAALTNYDVGRTLARLRRFDEAEQYLRRAVELNDGFADAYAQLGVVLQHSDRLDEALAACKKALDISPDLAMGRVAIAGVYLKKRDFAAAAEAYAKAAESKADWLVYTNLGNCLERIGKSDAAEAAYRTAISLQPDAAQAHYNLGFLLAQMGRKKDAIAEVEKAISLEPGNADARALLQELQRLAP